MNIRKFLFTTILALGLPGVALPPAMAGDPGPYRLVFFDISVAPYQDGQKLAIELRKMDALSNVQKEYCFFCQNSQDVETLYLYSVPVGLNAEDLRKAVSGDDDAKRRMQTILDRFVGAQNIGVDGLLIYQHTEGKVTIYTMDKQIDSPLQSESKSVKQYLLHSSLDSLLESAAQKLNRPV